MLREQIKEHLSNQAVYKSAIRRLTKQYKKLNEKASKLEEMVSKGKKFEDYKTDTQIKVLEKILTQNGANID